MNKISDDDLILLYYGEHVDAGLAVKVAESEALSARFDALSAELNMADAFVPPERGENYGVEVWQKISPRLDIDQRSVGGNPKNWLSKFGPARFSFAGVAAVSLLVVVAFVLGRQGGPGDDSSPLIPGIHAVTLTSSIDSGRLLTHSVADHLEQVNLVLTEFANVSQASGTEAEQATDMLLANRLYRQAAAAQGDQKLAAFLARLEPILLEMAYEAQTSSAATRERMQKEISDDLLFRVRVMNNQLKSL